MTKLFRKQHKAMAYQKTLATRDYYQSNDNGKFVSFLPKPKRFNVEASRHGAFWADYREFLASGDNPNIGEVPIATAPMVAKLNLSFVRLDGVPSDHDSEPELEAESPKKRNLRLFDGESASSAPEPIPERASPAKETIVRSASAAVTTLSAPVLTDDEEGESSADDECEAEQIESSSDSEAEGGAAKADSFGPALRGDYAAELAIEGVSDDSDASSDEIAESAHSSTKELLLPFVKAFVLTFQKVVERELRCRDDDGTSFCVVLGSEPKKTAGGETTVTLQFHMPYAHSSVQVQTDLIRPRLISQLCLDNVLAKLPSGPTGSWQEIIDRTVPAVNLPLYGSTRTRDEPVLRYWEVYAPSAHFEAAVAASFDASFNMSNHTLFKNGTVSDDFVDGWTNEERLALYLSVDYFARPLQPRKEFGANLLSEACGADGSVADIGDKLARASIFLKMSSASKLLFEPRRREEVAQALRTVSKGSEEGLNILVNHIYDSYADALRHEQRKAKHGTEKSGDCAQGNRHKTGCCGEVLNYKRKLRSLTPITRTEIKRDLAYIYGTPAKVALTDKTLAWFAKIDNPEEFNEWHGEIKRKTLEKAISLTDHDIAQAFYDFNWLTLAYSPRDKSWYIYKRERWYRYVDAETQLVEIVDKYFIGDILTFQAAIASETAAATGATQEAKLKLSAGLLNLVARLKKTTPLLSMIRRAKSKFLVDDFSAMLDSRHDLVGVRNGVIELSANKARFRSGKPEDYISKSTNIDYRLDFDSDQGHPSLCLYHDYLNKVHRNPRVRKFFRYELASVLLAGNAEKKFGVWSGDTNNSKSICVKILQKALGDYCIDFSTTMVTGQKTNAEAPSPQLAQAKGARLGIMAEPDENEKIQSGTLKMLTGGDRFFARFLHDNGGSIENTVKIVLVCNAIPPVPRGGKAVIDRLMVVPFESTWSHDAPADLEEQLRLGRFPIDPFFERNVPELAHAMLWLMVHDYAGYRSEGLVIPPEVKARTDKYWSETDIFRSFFEDNVAKSEEKPAAEKAGGDDYCTLKDLYTRYKEWFSEMCPGMKPVPNQLFKAKAVEHLGACDVRSRWYGHHVKAAYI